MEPRLYAVHCLR